MRIRLETPMANAVKRNMCFTGKSTSNHNRNITEKRLYLFVSRLSAQTSCEDLEKFLKESRPDGAYSVEKLNSM